MKLLKNQTYLALLHDISTARAEAKQRYEQYLEMETRKDYLKGEFTRVSILLDECKEQLKRTNIGLERTLENEEKALKKLLTSQEQCMRLATGLAKSFSTEEILKKQLASASDLIKKLNRAKRG